MVSCGYFDSACEVLVANPGGLLALYGFVFVGWVTFICHVLITASDPHGSVELLPLSMFDL